MTAARLEMRNAARLSSEPDAPAEQRAQISDAIDGWNMDVTGDHDYRPVAIFLRDDDGSIRGGVTGGVWGTWLHVVALWVDEPLRAAVTVAASCWRPRQRHARQEPGMLSSRHTPSRRPVSINVSATSSSRSSKTIPQARAS